MKRFLSKTGLYLLIQLTFILVFVYYYTSNLDIPFYSNSISFNAKAKFLIKNHIQLENYPVVVIGSSMSLNNLDCVYLSGKLKQPIINLSSWGMTFDDFDAFDIWEKNKIILTNVNFTDIGLSAIIKKRGYPYSENKLLNFTNILTDFSTYKAEVDTRLIDSVPKINDFYRSLKFDRSGSVLFTERHDFQIYPTRWNQKQQEVSAGDIERFISGVKQKSLLVKHIIISFSPSRRSVYSSNDSKTVKLIQNQLKSTPNISFIDNYDAVNFNDDDFVDFCHFSNSGAKKYNELLYSQLLATRVFN